LNGQAIAEREQAPAAAMEEVAKPVTLRAGWNTLVLRVDLGAQPNRVGVWFSARSPLTRSSPDILS